MNHSTSRSKAISRALVAAATILLAFTWAAPANAVDVITTLAGTGHPEFNDDKQNPLATNVNPTRLAFDFSGRELYFIDSESRIRKIDVDGRVITVAGTGDNSFNEDQLDPLKTNVHPIQIAFHPHTGELYFNDGGSRIRKINGRQRVETVAGTGQKDYNGDSNNPLQTNINPDQILFHPSNDDLYFTDGGTRIRRLNHEWDGWIETIAGSGDAKFNENQSDPLETDIEPVGMAFHPKTAELYFTDGSSRIRKIDRELKVRIIAGTGDQRFNGDQVDPLKTNIHPWEIGFHPDTCELFFIDEGSRIRKIDAESRVKTLAGNGNQTFNGDKKNPLEASIFPSTIGFHPLTKQLYFTDAASRIRVLDQGGVRTLAGTGSQYFNGDKSDALQSNINPCWTAIHPKIGEFYFSDLMKRSIRAFHETPIFIAGATHYRVAVDAIGTATAVWTRTVEGVTVVETATRARGGQWRVTPSRGCGRTSASSA